MGPEMGFWRIGSWLGAAYYMYIVTRGAAEFVLSDMVAAVVQRVHTLQRATKYQHVSI